jgi:hypothetical protein
LYYKAYVSIASKRLPSFPPYIQEHPHRRDAEMRIKRALAGGIAAVVLTAAFGGATFAQTPSPKPAEQFLEALAGKLGKTPAEVRSAVVAVQKERVAADLAAGRITQEQANRLNQRIDQANGLGAFHPRPGVKPGPKGKPAAGVKAPVGGAELATFLGVQPPELRQALASGKSLAAFAQEKGKSRDDLKAFLTTQHRTQLSAAVTAGRITQAQADQRLTQFTSQLDRLIDRSAPAKPKRGPRA